MKEVSKLEKIIAFIDKETLTEDELRRELEGDTGDDGENEGV